MSHITDQRYLLTEQYQNANNLNARIELHQRFSTNQYGFPCWAFDQLSLPSNATILELGCGPGNLWVYNLQRVLTGWNITLSDFSMGMLREARQSLSQSHHPFTFVAADAQAIPFADHSFDALIANHMLYHIPDRTRALAEIRRVLKPGGRFYAATNGPNHMQELQELAARFDSNIIIGTGDRNEFDLENGHPQIAQHFSNVAVYHYEDALNVTEATPLVAYVLSGVAQSTLTDPDRVAEFGAFIEQELVAHGAIHITKEVGLFEAW